VRSPSSPHACRPTNRRGAVTNSLNRVQRGSYQLRRRATSRRLKNSERRRTHTNVLTQPQRWTTRIASLRRTQPAAKRGGTSTRYRTPSLLKRTAAVLRRTVGCPRALSENHQRSTNYTTGADPPADAPSALFRSASVEVEGEAVRYARGGTVPMPSCSERLHASALGLRSRRGTRIVP